MPDVAIEDEIAAHAAPIQLRQRLQGRLWGVGLAVLARSWRSRVLGLEHLQALEQQGERALLAMWHGEYPPLLALFWDHPVETVTTDTAHGRIVDVAAATLQHRCHRRPPGLRGTDAHRFARERLASASRVAIVADGPAGPPRRVKRGVLSLAADLDLRLMPVACAACPAYERDRWDRQLVVPPFARVVAAIGEPLPALPREMGDRRVESEREALRSALEATRGAARRCLAGHPGRRAGSSSRAKRDGV